MADPNPDGTNPDGQGTPESRQPRKVGVVTGDKMQKTRTVVIERLVKHRLYHKYIRRRTVLKVHDEENTSKVGDRVEVEFSRPLSKTKRWRLLRVVERAAGV